MLRTGTIKWSGRPGSLIPEWPGRPPRAGAVASLCGEVGAFRRRPGSRRRCGRGRADARAGQAGRRPARAHRRGAAADRGEGLPAGRARAAPCDPRPARAALRRARGQALLRAAGRVHVVGAGRGGRRRGGARARALPHVSKPVQYVGGELNSQVKDWDVAGNETVRWALMYPDAYEVGVPNQGVMILYEVLNERPDALAERTYAVWPDMEALMREHGVPQFTVDAHRPVGAFDLFGVSFSTELGYTNLLTALGLAGIPLQARDRTDEHPVVVAGGHAAFNPEPIADFVAAVLGDGEQAVLEITDLVKEWKAEGRPGGRTELLLRLARTGGVYVPQFYDVHYLPDGRIQRVVPNRPGVPWRVSKHTVMDLDEG